MQPTSIKNTLILDANVAKKVSGFKEDYDLISKMFPPYSLAKVTPQAPAMRALKFKTETDRNRAYRILESYKNGAQIDFQFYFKGEELSKVLKLKRAAS